MPTTSTTSQYDSNDRVFYPYTTNTAYINPYSSDRIGGELITEYNQRNALNTLCKKDMRYQEFAEQVKQELDATFGESIHVDPVTGEVTTTSAGLYSFKDTRYGDPNYWHVTAYATGVQDTTDFAMRYANSILYISSGKAMINGYNIESNVEISFDINDVIKLSDVTEVTDLAHHQASVSNPICSMFVKMVLMLTTDGTHDERLNPPVDGTYMSVAIVVDDTLQRENELLLGVITRDSNGDIDIIENTLKTRLLPLDAVAGAEGYDELINSSNMEDGRIYGLQSDAPHHIADITSKIWLDNNSNIAKLLKGLSAQAETATVDYHKNTRGLITTEGYNAGSGDSNSALKHSVDTYPSLMWYQTYALEGDANATLERRNLYYPFAYCDDVVINKEIIPPPEGSTVRQYQYNDINYPEISGRTGRSGYITGQQIYMLETAYKHAANPIDSGKQYGPFDTVEQAVQWFTQHPNFEYKLGDYFWVLNDTIESIQADYGTIRGSVSGNVSGTVTGTVSGTGECTANVVGSTVNTHEDITGSIENGTVSFTNTVVTGNVSGNTTGIVTGKWDGFTQNVSTRYSCVYSGTNKGVRCITRHVDYVGSILEPTTTSEDNPQYITGTGTAWFVLQAVERGFSIPATANTFGLVKAAKEDDSTNTTILDVIVNNTTGRLNVNQTLYNMIVNGGFETDGTKLPIELHPGDTITNLWHKIYTEETVTIKLVDAASAWEVLEDSMKTLKSVRGHVILDYSELAIDDNYTGGIIFNLVDVDCVTLHGDNTEVGTHKATRVLKLSFDHCKVDTPFFENIGKWTYSSFISGSNTIELNNPWMVVDKPFSDFDYINNKLYTRFASVTMGENGISSAMMDMWIQYENTQPDNRSVDHCWVSRVRANFPPLMCEFTSLGGSSVTTGNINEETIQYIPGDISMKIGATAGVHEVITAQNEAEQVYTPSGNLLATVDWSYNTHYDVNNAPSEQLYLNLYMKNSSGEPMQKISNLKFRVPVQVTRLSDNSSVFYTTYKSVYGDDPEVIV